MAIELGCVLPHPPIAVPEIGGKESALVARTRQAMERVAVQVAEANPDCIAFISPHSHAFSDAFAIQGSPHLTCTFDFPGARHIRYSLENDGALAEAVEAEANALGLPTFMLDKKYRAFGAIDALDHGIGVPLYFIWKEVQKPIVSLSISDTELDRHYLLGIALQRAAERLGKKVVFVASGDLSHALAPGAPAPYAEEGAEFDALIERIVAGADFEELLSIDRRFAAKAAECGLRSVVALAGAFDGYAVKTRVLSYEGPFGVGYMVATVERGAPDARRDFLGTRKKNKTSKIFDPFTGLAKTALTGYLSTGIVPKPPDDLSSELLNSRAGCFVCLKHRGELRGCIGTLEPTQRNLAAEIISNTIQAATSDPRFPSVEESELPYLKFSVDILEPSERIGSLDELDTKTYGVIVKRGYQVGVLLPRLEGIDTADEQVAIAKQKAGIAPSQEAELFRFKVRRYEEE